MVRSAVTWTRYRTFGVHSHQATFVCILNVEARVLDAVGALLEGSPLLALFAAIGIGYAVGRISIAGFSLDIGAVLFAGLALGAIAPDAAPPALVSSIGLVMFLYGIGIQYGRQFFAGLGGAGLMWNALGVAGVFVRAGRGAGTRARRSACLPRTRWDCSQGR